MLNSINIIELNSLGNVLASVSEFQLVYLWSVLTIPFAGVLLPLYASKLQEKDHWSSKFLFWIFVFSSFITILYTWYVTI